MPKPDQEWARRRLAAKNDEDRKNRQNPKVVQQIQKEAKAAGATLAHGGRGGLDPRLALKVFRKWKFTCSVKGCKTPKQNLDLDHLGGHGLEIKADREADPKVKAAADLKHQNSLANIVVKCERHHDEVHQRERAIENGKKPAPMGT